MHSKARIMFIVLPAILCAGCGVTMTNAATGSHPETPKPTESSASTSSPSGSSAGETPIAAPITAEILELAEQYRELRNIKGHYSGGAWNDNVDRFGGRLHTSLTRLGEVLGNGAYKRADIIRLMGEPDAVLSQGSEEHLIYFWRGWHDYLYFVCQAEVIQEAGWYFAYE